MGEMAEIAEMILNGTLCGVCGAFVGEAVGYPRTCAACADNAPDVAPQET